MAFPALLLNPRVLTFIGGLLIGAVAKSDTVKTGVSNMQKSLEKDFKKNEQLVKDIRAGRMR